jgi:hypothetical protein
MAERVRRGAAKERFRDERGQASVELLAGIPALLLAGVISLQLLAVGYSATLADGAVEAGALAVAAGEPAEPAVRSALPGWSRDRVETEVEGGRVTVTVRPPALLDALARGLEVEDSAWVRPAS